MSEESSLPFAFKYRKGNIEITRDNLILRWYYFPCGARTIKLEDITKVEEREVYIGSTKTWGMALDLEVWWHFDGRFRELNSKKALIVFTNEENKYPAGITPDEESYSVVLSLLRQH